MWLVELNTLCINLCIRVYSARYNTSVGTLAQVNSINKTTPKERVGEEHPGPVCEFSVPTKQNPYLSNKILRWRMRKRWCKSSDEKPLNSIKPTNNSQCPISHTLDKKGSFKWEAKKFSHAFNYLLSSIINKKYNNLKK